MAAQPTDVGGSRLPTLTKGADGVMYLGAIADAPRR